MRVFPDPCNVSPCENGGTCENENGNAKCVCINGFTGKKCENGACNAPPPGIYLYLFLEFSRYHNNKCNKSARNTVLK